MVVPVVQVCSDILCHSVGGTHLVLNQVGPLPVGSGKKHFDMGEHFDARRPLVPLPTIIREHFCVKQELAGVIDPLLALVRHVPGIGVRDCIVDMPPDYIDGVGRGVRLAEALVVH